MFESQEWKVMDINNKAIGHPLIMIVDDNLSLLEVMRQALKHEGYRVIGANNGHDALMLLYKYTPSLIVSDYVMPVLDGCKFLSVVKASKQHHHIPFVLMSKLKNSRANLADYRLPKPFSMSDFVNEISAIIAIKRHLDGGFSI